jgi:probable rRNA maturation factor
VTAFSPRDQRLVVEMRVTSEAWNDLIQDAEPWARRILRETLIGAGARAKIVQGCALSLLFADDAEIRALNRRFRGKDKPTNVLSFPAAAAPSGEAIERLGDIAFALQTVRAEAAAGGRPFGHHLTHLLVHGILHLLGHDHETDEEARRMSGTEIAVLSKLGLPDPYAAHREAADAR